MNTYVPVRLYVAGAARRIHTLLEAGELLPIDLVDLSARPESEFFPLGNDRCWQGWIDLVPETPKVHEPK